MVFTLIIGLVLGYLAGSSTIRSGGVIGALGGGRMTRKAWMEKVRKNDLLRQGGLDIDQLPKDKFLSVMGEPDKSQAVGNEIIWYYHCTDGEIQMILDRNMLEHRGRIDTMNKSINEY